MGFFYSQFLFHSGRLLISDEVIRLAPEYISYLHRHQSGEWGSICPECVAANRNAVQNGDEILSLYAVTLAEGIIKNLCIMTEKHRTYTVMFFLSKSDAIILFK